VGELQKLSVSKKGWGEKKKKKVWALDRKDKVRVSRGGGPQRLLVDFWERALVVLGT